MDIRELGNRIKDRREKLNLRQSDIAGALRISAQAVSKWERGGAAPDITVLPELAGLLGVSIEWLLGATSPDKDTFPATVFCTSLNGFAEKTAAMKPSDVASWVNGLYFTLTDSVLHYEGIPVKYVGDGSLAFFTGAGSCRRAFDAALRARRALDTLDVVITLHYGEIFLGTIGHPDYERTDVIGATVNTAFLAMPWVAENCKSGIGITGAVADYIDEKKKIKKRGSIDVLGLSEPVTIYEPVI